MKWFFFFLIVGCLHFSDAAEECEAPQDKHVVCYYGSWAIHRQGDGYFNVSYIDPTLCTHLVYSFAGLDIESKITYLDYNLDIVQGNYANFINLKEKNPCLKVLLAIGGWNEGSRKFSVMVSTPESRTAFAENAIRFLTFYGFDGLDFDWEYPNHRGGINDDITNFSALLKELHDKLSKWGLLLSIAIPMDPAILKNTYEITALQSYVDYVSIMAYDYTSADSDKTGLLAPLTIIKESLDYLQALSPSKIILGLPAYARTFTLADAANNGLGDPTTGPGTQGKFTREPGFLSYYELQLKLQNSRYERNCVDGNCYAYYKLDWLTYDSIDTIKEKVQLVNSRNLGGVMLWTIDTDDFSGDFGEKYTILNTIREELNKNKKKP